MEETVTLFIQGHGSEYISHPLKNEPNVQLLSFVGMPGVLGQMVFCEHNDKPIDINIIEYLNKIYSKTYGTNGNLNFQSQLSVFNLLPDLLKKLYEECDIIYTKGFSKIWPRWERYFSFKPGEHENCRLCTVTNDLNKENNSSNLGKDCIRNPGRCLPERNISNLCCPEYGLTIVASSFQEDIPFTLANKNVNRRTEANMNMSLSTKEYWKSRTPTHKEFVDQIFNEKYIFLSQLITLFKSMGFKYIYLLDPTCRSCKIDTDKAEEYRALENTIPENKIFTSQPNNSTFISSKPTPKTNYFDDCINGVCGYFNKTKVDGGQKRKTRKVFKNKIKIKKRKTKKYLKMYKQKTKKIKRNNFNSF
jgi:hypothetical protein